MTRTDVIPQLLGEQYKGKQKLMAPNLDAYSKGYDYAKANLEGACDLSVRRAANVGDKIFIDGNAAAALGCVYGGASVCAWYPITPSSSVAEAFQNYCAKLRVDKETGENRFAIVQAEDELASIGMVVGAGWNGARKSMPMPVFRASRCRSRPRPSRKPIWRPGALAGASIWSAP